MYLTADTLDDLLQKVFKKLLKADSGVGTTRGNTKELIGVMLKLNNPLARLSRTESKGHVFSCLGELAWYLSGSSCVDDISYYIRDYKEETEDDGKTIHGAYGPRIFGSGINAQIENAISRLSEKPNSRRVVVQIYDRLDLSDLSKKDIPCTCTMQFMIRANQLHLITYMRSNDAYKGLPHDVFAFTMIQEIMARRLGVRLGTYRHVVGSLHLYEDTEDKAVEYMQEGFQASKSIMSHMPQGDPSQCLKQFLLLERKIRDGETLRKRDYIGIDYWDDLTRLLLIFRLSKDRNTDGIAKIRSKMKSKTYNSFIIRRQQKRKTSREPKQLGMQFA